MIMPTGVAESKASAIWRDWYQFSPLQQLQQPTLAGLENLLKLAPKLKTVALQTGPPPLGANSAHTKVGAVECWPLTAPSAFCDFQLATCLFINEQRELKLI